LRNETQLNINSNAHLIDRKWYNLTDKIHHDFVLASKDNKR
jgi:hypothetical protein